MKSLPNILSFLRIPLAFMFLSDSYAFRFLALFLAAISDGLDGFLARRYNASSRLGTILDPIADKFFVLFVLTVLFREQQILLWQAFAMISRDMAVVLFGFYLAFTNNLKRYECRAIWTGKISTCLQFGVLLSIVFHATVPLYMYAFFVVLGLGAFLELYLTHFNDDTLSEHIS